MRRPAQKGQSGKRRTGQPTGRRERRTAHSGSLWSSTRTCRNTGRRERRTAHSGSLWSSTRTCRNTGRRERRTAHSGDGAFASAPLPPAAAHRVMRGRDEGRRRRSMREHPCRMPGCRPQAWPSEGVGRRHAQAMPWPRAATRASARITPAPNPPWQDGWSGEMAQAVQDQAWPPPHHHPLGLHDACLQGRPAGRPAGARGTGQRQDCCADGRDRPLRELIKRRACAVQHTLVSTGLTCCTACPLGPSCTSLQHTDSHRASQRLALRVWHIP